VVSVVQGDVITDLCEVYIDLAGVMRVANSDEFVRCFT
jgi:hypothetical protein